MSTPTVIDVDASTFDEEVIAASFDRPVIVDFWADWCGPCHQLSPVLEEIVESFDGQVRLAKVAVPEEGNRELAVDHGVQGLPTVLAIRDGEVRYRFTGVHSAPWIEAFIKRLLPSDAN